MTQTQPTGLSRRLVYASIWKRRKKQQKQMRAHRWTINVLSSSRRSTSTPTFTRMGVPYFGNFVREQMKIDMSQVLTRTPRPTVIVRAPKSESLSSERVANDRYPDSSAANQECWGNSKANPTTYFHCTEIFFWSQSTPWKRKDRLVAIWKRCRPNDAADANSEQPPSALIKSGSEPEK